MSVIPSAGPNCEVTESVAKGRSTVKEGAPIKVKTSLGLSVVIVAVRQGSTMLTVKTSVKVKVSPVNATSRSTCIDAASLTSVEVIVKRLLGLSRVTAEEAGFVVEVVVIR